jgi:hypothetical protein
MDRHLSQELSAVLAKTEVILEDDVGWSVSLRGGSNPLTGIPGQWVIRFRTRHGTTPSGDDAKDQYVVAKAHF